MACPNGVTEDGGMTLPGNGVPVVVSMMGIMTPFDPTDLEKSPDLSKSVGSFAVGLTPAVLVRVNSCEKKKKSLFFFVYIFGM
jgi:hypothetical protein